jgi:hypothetical protein
MRGVVHSALLLHRMNEARLRLAPLLPVHRSSLEELVMSTILLIVLIILLFAALPAFPYRMHRTPGQFVPGIRNRRDASRGHNASVMGTKTQRVPRTWLDRFKLWRRAYETKIFDQHREATGRGPTPEASQQAAEWLGAHARSSPTPSP